MSEDDVLFGYRLQLVDLAGRIGVTAACGTFGVHRSTFYAWKRKIEREAWVRCAHASVGGRGCRISSRRWSSNGSSPSRSATRAWGRAG